MYCRTIEIIMKNEGVTESMLTVIVNKPYGVKKAGLTRCEAWQCMLGSIRCKEFSVMFGVEKNGRMQQGTKKSATGAKVLGSWEAGKEGRREVAPTARGQQASLNSVSNRIESQAKRQGGATFPSAESITGTDR